MSNRTSKTTGKASDFIAAVFGKIPAREEQADTPQFRRLVSRDLQSIRKEMRQNWNLGLALYVRAKAAHEIAYLADGNILRAADLLWEQCERQCRISAPTRDELKWKLRHCFWRKLSEEALRVIAADQARLLGGAK